MSSASDRLAGYVLDNMEGAVDQAVFMARTDTPVAILGARGTGKMYIARILHQYAGGSPDTLISIDCREFRNREQANRRIREALLAGAGKTLVFKSPHLMNAESQLRLARQIATRHLADSSPPVYLPAMRFVALFPDSLPRLVSRGELQHKLASVFAAYPIRVPPMRHRPQAILRWAHKILAQESAARGLQARGFTPEAEQALRQHSWHGNISEIRQRVVRALEQKPDARWLAPLHLQLALSGRATADSVDLPLRGFAGQQLASTVHVPTAQEELELALADCLQRFLGEATPPPLGTWLEDEVVLAGLARYAGSVVRAAEFLQTSRRNLSRWLPVIRAREPERRACEAWAEPARLIQDWVRGLGSAGDSPLVQGQALLLEYLEARRELATVEQRAQLLGVTRPTYTRRVRDWRQRSAIEREAAACG